MATKIKINEQCIVRNQACKRIFSGSRICFVACPNSDEIAFELEIIKQKLREVNIEPYIAVDQRELQKDIFCEKICTKIIESLFCIVILNDVIDKNKNNRKPNANVYYEYGLMTAFRKHIIPVQLFEQKLAFNIQSLDTVKYTPKDFSNQIEEAIKLTILNMEEEKETLFPSQETPSYEWILDIMGLVKVDERFRYRNERILAVKSLNFLTYYSPADESLSFVTIAQENEPINDIIFRMKIMSLRIINYCDQMVGDIEKLEHELNNSYRASTIRKDRLNEINESYKRLRRSTLMLIKEDANIPSITKMYKSAVKNVDKQLNLEIVNGTKIKKLLTN